MNKEPQPSDYNVKSVQTSPLIAISFKFFEIFFIVKLFVCIPKVHRYKQRKYYLIFWLGFHGTSPYGGAVNSFFFFFFFLILRIATSVHVFYIFCLFFCGWSVEMDIFSWKYLNERFRVLLWAMSLTKESEHLASHRLC